MNKKISTLVVSATFILSCSVSVAAFADGMPFKEAKPQVNLTPMDKTTNDTQNKEQPVSVVAPAEAAPVAEAPASMPVPEAEAAAPAPVVPESRVVDVQPNTSFFGLSVGMYDPFTHNKKATSFNAEWQPGVKIAGVLQPIFGALATTGGSLYGYGGVGVPFNITDHVFLMPSVAVGAYKKGGGYDLDRTIVYRLGTEIAYQFDDKSRLGLNLHVLTNGTSTGRPDRTEVIGVSYTMPFEYLANPSRAVPEQMPAPLMMPSAAAPETAPADNATTMKQLPNELP